MVAETNSAPHGAMEERTAQKRTFKIIWSRLIPSIVFGLCIALAISADIANNVRFAWQTSGVLALVAGGIGAAFAVIPFVAFHVGWSKGLRILQACCGVTVVGFALMSYGDGQGHRMGARASAGITLADAANARQEATSARLEASRIVETLPVEALRTLQASEQRAFTSAEAAAKAQKLECVQNKRCRDAKAALDRATERLGQAQAKANLLVAAERADARASSKADKADAVGVAQVNATAAAIASFLGKSGVDTEADASTLLTLLVIATTVLFGYACDDLLKLAASSIVPHDPDKPTTPAGRKGNTRETVAKLLSDASEAPKSDLQSWIGKLEKSDQWSTAADIMAAWKLHQKMTGSVQIVSPYQLKKALTDAGFAYEANDKSKRTPARYGLKLPLVRSPHLVMAR